MHLVRYDSLIVSSDNTIIGLESPLLFSIKHSTKLKTESFIPFIIPPVIEKLLVNEHSVHEKSLKTSSMMTPRGL